MFDHDFELDDHLETLSTASALLERCDYIDVPKFDCDFSSLSASPSHLSFYFLNIDGFKTNYDEFTVIHLSLVNTFDIICFAETNVDSSDLKKFTLGHEYLCLDIPKLNDKQFRALVLLFFTVNLSSCPWLKACVTMALTLDFRYLVVNSKLSMVICISL